MYMTREEYLLKVLYDHNKPKSKQTGSPEKYPQGFFNAKKCRHCGKEFAPSSPAELYCSDFCKNYAITDAYYKRVYRITLEEYLDLAEKQNFVCSICGKENFAMGQNHSGCLVVDHNHETGKVRGLLCHNCNRALGLFKDNPSVLQKAFEYLKV